MVTIFFEYLIKCGLINYSLKYIIYDEGQITVKDRLNSVDPCIDVNTGFPTEEMQHQRRSSTSQIVFFYDYGKRL